MSSYQYRKSHCGDKTILRPSYLHNGVPYTGKTTFLYWIGALFPNTTKHNIAGTVCIIARMYKMNTSKRFNKSIRWYINQHLTHLLTRTTFSKLSSANRVMVPTKVSTSSNIKICNGGHITHYAYWVKYIPLFITTIYQTRYKSTWD